MQAKLIGQEKAGGLDYRNQAAPDGKPRVLGHFVGQITAILKHGEQEKVVCWSQNIHAILKLMSEQPDVDALQPVEFIQVLCSFCETLQITSNLLIRFLLL